MRAVVQRVSRARVMVDGVVAGAIDGGLAILLGVGPADDGRVADAFARKVAELRIFRDEAGLTNRSLLDVGGSALVVSQFTLYADTRRGRRPSFIDAAPPDQADALYRRFCEALEGLGVVVARGRFGSEMAVELVNDGPFTIWLDTDAATLTRTDWPSTPRSC